MRKIILKIIYYVLAKYARHFIQETKPYVIWVTWNVGKTSCRMILYKVLEKHIINKKIYTSPKNYNSELWFIFSIFGIEEFIPWIIGLFKICIKIRKLSIKSRKIYDIIILEYGIDHPWDMDFLVSIVKPDISIFTKLWSIHIENFWTIEDIGNEKFKLIFATKDKTYLNYEDDFSRIKYDEVIINKQFFNNSWFDFVYLLKWKKIYSKLSFDWIDIKTNILWCENFSYIQLSYLILKDFWLWIDINKEFLELKNQPWRFTVFNWIKQSILIDSTYNAWPESMKMMIENTHILRKSLFPDYKLWFVIWDMRELWKYSKELHENLYQKLKDYDLLITVWLETRKYFPKEIKNYLSSRQAWIYLKSELLNSNEKYIILFKWSQNTIFVEEALKQVLINKNDYRKLVRQDDIWMSRKG